MAADPAFALQVALVTLGKANAGVTALIGSRIWDAVPANPLFPYVTIGEADVHSEAASLGEFSETYANIHIWDRGSNSPAGLARVKQIGDAWRTALLSTKLAPIGHQLVSQLPQRHHVMRDPDGLTAHGVLVVRILSVPLPA